MMAFNVWSNSLFAFDQMVHVCKVLVLLLFFEKHLTFVTFGFFCQLKWFGKKKKLNILGIMFILGFMCSVK